MQKNTYLNAREANAYRNYRAIQDGHMTPARWAEEIVGGLIFAALCVALLFI